MVFDFVKILKKMLKFWYVFVATIILCVLVNICLPVRYTRAYVYSNQFRVEMFDTTDFEYYEFAQKQVLDNLHSSVGELKKDLAGQDISTNFSVGVADVNVLVLTTTSNDKEECVVNYTKVKAEIINYISDHLLDGYSHKLASIGVYQIGTESLQDNITKVKNNLSTINKAFVLLFGLEIAVFVVLGFLDDRIISSDELKQKFEHDVIAKLPGDKQLLDNWLKQNEGCVIYDLTGVDKSKGVLNNVDDTKQQKKLLDAKSVVLKIEINKTKEKEIAKVIEFLKKANKDKVVFVII